MKKKKTNLEEKFFKNRTITYKTFSSETEVLKALGNRYL